MSEREPKKVEETAKPIAIPLPPYLKARALNADLLVWREDGRDLITGTSPAGDAFITRTWPDSTEPHVLDHEAWEGCFPDAVHDFELSVYWAGEEEERP